jgi:hypothetical protein
MHDVSGPSENKPTLPNCLQPMELRSSRLPLMMLSVKRLKQLATKYETKMTGNGLCLIILLKLVLKNFINLQQTSVQTLKHDPQCMRLRQI